MPAASATATQTSALPSTRRGIRLGPVFFLICQAASNSPAPMTGHHTHAVSDPAKALPITSTAVETIHSPKPHALTIPSPVGAEAGTIKRSREYP